VIDRPELRLPLVAPPPGSSREAGEGGPPGSEWKPLRRLRRHLPLEGEPRGHAKLGADADDVGFDGSAAIG